MKIGARVIKTGLAVMVALYVSMVLGFHPPVFAAIAAVISIQPSVYRSITTFIEQIKANIIGAVIAVLMGLLFGTSPLIVGLTVIVVIFVNLLLKYEKSISISVLTSIAIMESANGHFIEYSLQRFTLIIIGMLAATVINALFMPPKHEGKISELIGKTNAQLTLLLIDRSSSTYIVQKEDINRNIKMLEDLFEVYREEVFFRRYPFQKKRELITYKRMISLFKKELKLLRQMKRIKDEAVIVEMEQKIMRLVEVQRKILHDTWHAQSPLSVTFDLSQYDPRQLRPIALLVDIELEMNKLLRNKQRKYLHQSQTELGQIEGI